MNTDERGYRYVRVGSTLATHWDIWMTNQSGAGCGTLAARNVNLGSAVNSVAALTYQCVVKPPTVDPWRPLYQFSTGPNLAFEVSGEGARFLMPPGFGITVRVDPAVGGANFFNLRWAEN